VAQGESKLVDEYIRTKISGSMVGPLEGPFEEINESLKMIL